MRGTRKSKFSKVVKHALYKRPQGITVLGQFVAVLVSHAECTRLTKPGFGFVELICISPPAWLAMDIADHTI